MARALLISRVLNDICTIANGKDFCYGKIIGLVVITFTIGMTAYNTFVLEVEFNIGEFSKAISEQFLAIGGLIFMKKSDEPGGPATAPQPATSDK